MPKRWRCIKRFFLVGKSYCRIVKPVCYNIGIKCVPIYRIGSWLSDYINIRLLNRRELHIATMVSIMRERHCCYIKEGAVS